MFEGFLLNTEDKLHQNQVKYDLKIPMAHASGSFGKGKTPAVMKNYRSGGTPWTVIIDPSGKVVYNAFHIKVQQAIVLIEQLTVKAD